MSKKKSKKQKPKIEFGWLPPEERTQSVAKSHDDTLSQTKVFSASSYEIQDSGRGKKQLLHNVLTKINGGQFPIKQQAIGDCFVAGTTVLGKETKPIEDVRVGDQVYGGDGRLTRVVSTRVKVTNKPLVKITPVGGLSITCTSDHKILVCRMEKVGQKSITPNLYQRAKNGQSVTSPKKVITSFEERQLEWINAIDLKENDLLLTPTPNVSPKEQTILSSYVLGYFLGNGYAAKRNGYTWEITTGNCEIANSISEECKTYGWNSRVEKYGDRNAWRVRIHSKELCDWSRENFYNSKDEKVYPDWAIGDEEFLQGLWEADGFYRDGTNYFDNTSKSVIYGAQTTLISMREIPNLTECSRSEGTYDNAKPLYRLTWNENRKRQRIWKDENYIYRPIRKIEILEGKSIVYDIGVEDDHHSFLAEGYVVHNCVSFGFALCIETLMAVEITLHNEPEEWPDKEIATEWIYGTSRVLVGGGRLGNSDGSLGSWASKAVREHGTLLRKKYGSYNLSTYSGSKAKSWGYRGLPSNQLEPIADEHPVKTTSLITSYDQAVDSIFNGYPVAVCSNQGFSSTRDSEGFARASGSWAHCMAFVSMDDESNRPGLLCVNSWGPSWIRGPKRHNQPEGSFWVDAQVADRMLRQQDSYALSNFEGYPRRELNYENLW